MTEAVTATAATNLPRPILRAYKTAVFKIHNPSRHKRAVLDDALQRNHLAYTKVLRKLLPRLDEFRGVRAGKKRESAIYRAAAPLVNPLPLGIGAKAGLISDVAGQLSSHIELEGKQEAPSPPTASRLHVSAGEWDETLRRLSQATTLDEENAARDELFRELRQGQLRPILLLKNRVTDGYLLLKDAATGRVFVWLNLHSKDKSRFARPVQVRDLADLRTGEMVSFASRTGALFLLAFGREHQDERFIRCGRPQSAKLLRRGDRYEVHVTFEYERERLEPQHWLGVDRGIYNLASLAVVSAEGEVVDRRNVDGRQLRHVQRLHERRQRDLQKRGRRYSGRSRRAMADEAVHVTANEIVELAAQHQAQVVLENLRNLTYRGGPRKRSSFNRMLNRSQFAKLQQVLEYKLPAAGLARPKSVSAAWTSQTCPRCGHQARENRPKAAAPDGDGFTLDRFTCVQCGYQDDADLNAARIIALKKVWRDQLPSSQRTKAMSELAEDYSFRTFLRDRAGRRDAAREASLIEASGTSGGRDAAAGPDQPPPFGAGSPAADQHPMREQKPSVMQPELSSSSEIPRLAVTETRDASDG